MKINSVNTFHRHDNVMNDKLCKILLDKDNVLPDIPEAKDAENLLDIYDL